MDEIAARISKAYVCDINDARKLLNKIDCDNKTIRDIIAVAAAKGYCKFVWRNNTGEFLKKLAAEHNLTDNDLLEKINDNSKGIKLPTSSIPYFFQSNVRLRNWIEDRLEEIFELAKGMICCELIIDD